MQNNRYGRHIPGAQGGSSGAPAGGPVAPPLEMVVPPRPRQYTPQSPQEQRRTDAAARRDEAETANLPDPATAQRLREAQIAQAEAAARSAQTEAQTRSGALDGLISQVIRVGQLYNQNFRDNDGLISSVGQLFPSSTTRQFNTAGRGINNPFMAAFRTPGVGTQTDADLLAFIEANEPNSWDFDSQIEEKLGNIRRRIDAQLQATGRSGIDWEASFRAGRPVPLQPRTTPDMPGQTAGGATVSNDIGYLAGNTRPEAQVSGTTATEPVFDPVHAGHAMRVAHMISSGAPDQEIIDYAVRNGLADPNNLEASNLPTILRGRNDPNSWAGSWIRQNPGRPFPLNEEGLYFQRERPLSERVLGTIGQSPVGTFAIHAGDAASFGTLDNIGDLTGLASSDTINAALAGTREQNPISATLGSIEGGIAGSYPVANLPLNAARLGSRIPQAVRPFVDDAIVGTGYGLGATNGDPSAAVLNGAFAVAGGTAGRGAVRGAGHTLTGVTNRTAQALRDADIALTPGQAVASTGGRVGQVARGIENAATSIPGVGHAISRRHAAQRVQYNRATWNEALQPIGGSVGDAVGEEAAEAAMRQVQGAYVAALNGRTFRLDRPMTQALDSVANSSRNVPLHGAWLEQFVNGELRQVLRARGGVSGMQVQAARQLIRDNIATFARERGGEAVVRELRRLETGLERMMGRQHRDVLPALRNVDRAYRHVAVARDATLQASNQGGIFTPAQLGQVARRNSIRFGGRNSAASTRRPFYQSQRDAQNVLPNNVPDSGTASRLLTERVATGGLLASGTGLAEYNDMNAMPWAAGVLGGLALLNTRRGANYTVNALMARPEAMRTAGNALLGDAPVRLGPIRFGPSPQLIGGRAVVGAIGENQFDPVRY